MKVGDLVKWADFIGVITKIDGGSCGRRFYRVHWADGGASNMLEDELKRFKE